VLTAWNADGHVAHMTDTVIGHVHSRFAAMQDVFARNFSEGLEHGASVAIVKDGEIIVDLWGGHADKAHIRPWDNTSLANVWSVSKAIVALAVAKLVEAGKLRYDDPLAKHWPEFAVAGKEHITLEQVLTHRSGLDGVSTPVDLDGLCDWPFYTSSLAAMAPNWEPGSRCAYHALSYGHLAGEVIRRVSGKSVGQFIADEIAAPLGVEFYIGLPLAQDCRRVDMIEGPGCYDWIETVLASPCPNGCMNPRPDANSANIRQWRAAEIPGGNGHSSALSLARIFGDVAGENSKLLSKRMRDDATRVRYRGLDSAFGFDTVWGAGFSLEAFDCKNRASIRSFGHGGWGGSLVFCDPDEKLGFAYVTNHMCGFPDGDLRRVRLIEALYDAL
jgi:CubicO group peptidase (beta-lactamase class C family)